MMQQLQSYPFIRATHTVKYILHFKGETERGSIVIKLSLTLVLHKHLNEHLRRTYMMLRASSSVSVNEGMG